MTSGKRRERKLPVQQLSILAICRFAEPISSTSLYPYLPEMVQSFQVPQNEVGKWAGICAAVFSLFQALMGIPWGRFSDKYGRKLAILLGLCTTMLTSLMWGFSRTLTMAIIARALSGMGNGNVGIIRTTVAEMVPFKELQPRAFSLMPLVWNVGSIFGPTIGGSLANPFNVKPGEKREGASLFETFPYLLPNLVSAVFFAVGITVGFLFLEETLETRREQRDYGLVLGKKLVAAVKALARLPNHALRTISKSDQEPHANGSTEREPLLKRPGPADDDESSLLHETKPKLSTPTWREVLNRQAIINLVVYTLLAMHAMAFDQLVPVFMQHDPIGGGDSTPYSPPFKFAGGFGLDHFEIGMMSTGYGIVGMVIQFFVFPPLARRYGVLFWLKAVAICFPIIYFITPFTALLPTKESRMVCMFTAMLLKCLCGIFAFPCSTILLTNSATSLRTLGTLNGFATSVSAVGRAAGPAMAGAIFSEGVKAGYVIAPWWFLTAVGIIAAVPIWWLVEGEGFGGDEVTSDEEDEDDTEHEDELWQAAAIEGGSQAAGKQVIPAPRPSNVGEDEEHEERAYGALAPLSRTNTTASSALLTDDEGESAGPANRSRSRRASGTERVDGEGQRPGTLSRRNSRRITRKISIPIGMGEGISRRYSSNLGQSFGSAGGH